MLTLVTLWFVSLPFGALLQWWDHRHGLAPGNYLVSTQNLIKPRRYEVTSWRQIARKELQGREEKLMLSVPDSIAPTVRA